MTSDAALSAHRKVAGLGAVWHDLAHGTGIMASTNETPIFVA
jgi:hypothetical protein